MVQVSMESVCLLGFTLVIPVFLSQSCLIVRKERRKEDKRTILVREGKDYTSGGIQSYYKINLIPKYQKTENDWKKKLQ